MDKAIIRVDDNVLSNIEYLRKHIDFRSNKISGITRKRYTRIVNNYFDFVQVNGVSIGKESAEKWLNSIEVPATHKLSLTALREYLLFLYKGLSAEKILEIREFFEGIPRKRPKEKVNEFDYLNKKQFDELVSVLTKNISFITQALFWTGCRASELVNIKLSDCKVNGKVVIRIRNGKGGKEREVFLSTELFSQIRDYFKGKIYLFETQEGNSYSREFISHEIKRQAKDKLKQDISAHTLRHSKAMYLKNEMKLSPDQIAKALGHSSPVTTLKYYFHGTPTAEEQGIV
jgi:integrase